MIQVSDSELRQIQLIQLEMLSEVDRICRKNNIHYNIIAGTMLGAVRHKGFIPWDDDADVALLREEYERFRDACKKDLDKSRFVFQDYRNTKGYRWGYGKIRRKNTLFLREHQEHMPYFQGIFIDIFPLDGVPDNVLLRSINCLECYIVRKCLWAVVGQYSERNPLIRLLFRQLARIPEDKIFHYMQRMVKRANRRHTRMVRILTFPTYNNEYGYLRRWYENSALIEFEGRMLQGIADYDSYLSFKFGDDYMTLPPKEKRKGHPVTKLKLC